MTNLNELLRKRVGFSGNELLTFEKLDTFLEKMAYEIPFENLSIIGNKTSDITKEGLLDKFVVKNEGGLCYELNSILYYFLVENGFSVDLIRGSMYDHSSQQWSTIGKTHVANLITHKGHFYLVDTGFGGNLPLKPVPLNGDVVVSSNGEFRIESVESEHGDHIFSMKLKGKDKDWKIGYAFDSREIIKNISELNEIQNIIRDHPDSPFNKRSLITRLSESGNVTLTETSFSDWSEGEVRKEEIDRKRFLEILKESFGIVLH